MSNTEDLEAIKNFFNAQQPMTAKGADIKQSFLSWIPTVHFNLLGMLGTSNSDQDIARAKRYRDDYNLAENPAAVAEQAHQTQLTHEEQESLKKGIVPHSILEQPKPTPKHKTIKIGSADKEGDISGDVAAWQRILGMAVTGKFTSQNAVATKKWQTDHGLKADGIVGPLSWAKAMNVTTPEGAPMPEPAERVAALTGGHTVNPAVTAAHPAVKHLVHQIATGAATGPQASKFQQHVRDIEAQAKNKLAEASALGVPKKLPRWAWAGMIGAALAGLGYTVFGRKKAKALRSPRYETR
jgi:peptidoglycan hydrolase-like protein with peptidoglycan-binding domain